MNLPIEPVPNTMPRRYRWRHSASTLTGTKTIDMEASVASTLQNALDELISLARQQRAHIDELQRDRDGLYAQLLACQERATALTEDHGAQAEKIAARDGPTIKVPPPEPFQPKKRKQS